MGRAARAAKKLGKHRQPKDKQPPRSRGKAAKTARSKLTFVDRRRQEEELGLRRRKR